MGASGQPPEVEVGDITQPRDTNAYLAGQILLSCKGSAVAALKVSGSTMLGVHPSVEPDPGFITRDCHR